MATDYVMPKLAMAMNEGTINEWLVESGEKVRRGQLVATIETEKVAYDLESPQDGYLHIVVAQGETVPVEVQIGIFADNEEELAEISGGSSPPVSPVPNCESAATAVLTAAPQATASAPFSGGRIVASPLARKLAKNNHLDLSLVSGSGPGGRIVKRDIETTLAREMATSSAAVSLLQAQQQVEPGSMQEVARIPMAGMRKAISDRMLTGMQTTAQLSSSWESDITDLLAIREKFVAREQQVGTKLSMNSLIIKAIAAAVKRVPIANSCLEGDEVVIYETINMGIAIAVPGGTKYDSGLMVGVMRDVGRMGIVEIDREMKALVERVRGGTANLEDLSGSTITLSSTAGIAPPGLSATPILNAPNSTLIGPSTAIERPVFHNGGVVVRTMMPVAMTFNHCVYDGEPATRFCKALHDCLENPELMLA